MAAILLLTGQSVRNVTADDWPTFRHDNRRSGACSDPIRPPLWQSWVFRPLSAPDVAWGNPQPKPVEGILELPRLGFDDAFQVAATAERVYFGSSSDTRVYALNADTGDLRWEFFTEGPVRLAPTLHNGRLYVGSDDGRVYCLDTDRGDLVWTFSAAPSPHRLLGNGRLISLWPVRTGVVIENNVAYVGAGVFPSEGLYLYALDAETGEILWKNDSYGRGGLGTVSPQGYMLASQDALFLSSGRTMPAAFRRDNGRFLHHVNFEWRAIGLFGGTYNVLADKVLFGGNEQLICARQDDGSLVRTEGLRVDVPSKGSRRLAIGADTLYYLNGYHLVAARLPEWQAGSARAEIWRTPCTDVGAIALTRDLVFVGGAGSLRAFDRTTGKETWAATIDGRALGLAVSGRRLLVSTDRGYIHCFVEGQRGTQRENRAAHIRQSLSARRHDRRLPAGSRGLAA